MHRARRSRQDGFRPKLIALSVAACFSVSAAQSLANPTGPTVASGSATFATAGNTLTVANSANAIINWQGFSIGVNEITRFLQSSSASAVLNRVVGSGGVIPQSMIDGVLQSNGRVFLLNPSGVAIGSTATINVAGLVASSLNLSDQDFLNGRMHFGEVPGAGAVVNNGTITTTSGGRVFLVAPDVQNTGIITTPQGQIVLAAGKSVDLVSEDSPFVTVKVTADSERALNLGSLVADSGRIDMAAALVRNTGVIAANSAVVGENGEIRLVATKDVTLDAGSVTTANGPSGGSVLVQAQGGTNLIYGTVEAKGGSGTGGTVQALGLRVGVVGNGVIDASGDAGGGTVLVGGDAHGANPSVQNAQQTLIGPNGVIRADAMTTGDGGRVVVWSDQYTQFYGNISARGGAQRGSGGFVETSGATLNALGGVDTSAPNGTAGAWLLDPDFITISSGGLTPLNIAPATCSIQAGLCFDDNPGTTSDVSVATIDAALASNSVTLQAHQDITLQTDLTLTNGAGNFFVANAGNNINLGNFNIATNGTHVTLSANDSTTTPPGPSGTGSITSGAGFGNIATNGGFVTLDGVNVTVGNINTTGAANSAGGVQIGTTSAPIAGNISTGSITAATTAPGNFGGTVTLVAGGTVAVNGTIDTRGPLGGGSFSAGGNGGDVTLYSPNSVAVYGSILTSGGDGATINGVGGGGGAGGAVTISNFTPTVVLDCTDGCRNVTKDIPSPLSGDVIVTGGITARGGNAANGGLFAATPNNGGQGGAGGSVTLLASGNVTVGSSANGGGIDASGGGGGQGNPAGIDPTFLTAVIQVAAGDGGVGGAGGSITLNSGLAASVGGNVGGSILTSGGAGGAGGNGAVLGPGSGATGGNGGTVSLTGTTAVDVSGTITSDGGAGGAGGSGGSVNATITTIDLGAGGIGGNGGSITATGGTISTGAVAATGGAGGAGGSNITATVTGANLLNSSSVVVEVEGSATAGSGGSGGTGGTIQLSGTGITTGAIDASGAAGGAGGGGGNVTVQADGGSTLPALAIATLGSGGSGGNAGTISVNGSIGISTGAIAAIGGSGGAAGVGGTASATATTTGAGQSANSSSSAGEGGTARFGGSVTLTGGSVSTGAITVAGGAGSGGGSGGNTSASASSPSSTFASANTGLAGSGSSAGSVHITGSAITTGAIDATGSAGGNGASGTASATSTSIGNGGGGGSGGAVNIDGTTSIATGTIDMSGGAGGNGVSGGAGGSGGSSFNSVSLTSSQIAVTGNILARGGLGGNGSSGADGGEGGSVSATAAGGTINVSGFIDISAGAGGNASSAGGIGGSGGALTNCCTSATLDGNSVLVAGGIVANGGNGGLGGPSGGSGGSGSQGGAVTLNGGTTIIGSAGTPTGISAHGGAGGAGGAGAASIAGGTGGNGGGAKTITIAASGNPVDIFGPIDVSAGAGGVGGAQNTGPSAGVAGTPGALGSTSITGGTITWLVDTNPALTSNYTINAGTLFDWVPLTGGANADVIASFFTGISAPLIRIGGGSMTGNILMDDANQAISVAVPLSLVTTGTISGANGLGLTIASLNADGGAGVTLNNLSSPTLTLQGRSAGVFTVINTGNINVQTVDTAPGATTPAGLTVTGAATLSSSGGGITQTDPISVSGTLTAAGATDILLGNPANSIPSLVVNTPGNATVESSGAMNLSAASANSVSLISGGGISVAPISVPTLSLLGSSLSFGGTENVSNLSAVATSGGLTLANGGTLNANVNVPGAVSLMTTSGDITGIALGSGISLNATAGAIGSPSLPFTTATGSLSAQAANGINIDMTSTIGAPVPVSQLVNTGLGDILLNAHGGVITNSLVSDPGGNVTINTFSPMTIGAGIAAGNSIFLSTAGVLPTGSPPNDMTLNGPFTYNTATGAFEVTIGANGTLFLNPPTPATPLALTAELFPNPFDITKFTFITSALPQSVQLEVNGSLNSTNQSTEPVGVLVPPDDPNKKKDEDNKKGVAACK